MIPVEYIDEILRGKWFDSDYETSQNAITSLSDISVKLNYHIADWAEIYRLVDISSCIYVPELSGYRFCDLRELKKLTPNDLFLVSKVKSSYFDEMNNRVESPRSFNYAYHQLSDQVLNDTQGLFTVGTMAYRNWWDYSEIGHHHDLIYNSVASVEVVNDYLEVNNTVSVMARISAGLSTEGLDPYTVVELCCPADQHIPVIEPAIGSIRLCYSALQSDNTSRRTGVEWLNSEDFDGWVMADGTQYTSNSNIFDFKQRFQKALAKIAGNPNAVAFTVPKLNGFYKWTDYFHSDESFNSVYQGHTSLLPHTHYISTPTQTIDDQLAEIEMEDIGTYHTARDLFTQPTMHAGRNGKEVVPLSLDTNLVSLHSYLMPSKDSPYDPITGDNPPEFSFNYSGESNPIPTLEHDIIPALVYIGGHMQNYILYEKYHNYRHRRKWEIIAGNK